MTPARRWVAAAAFGAGCFLVTACDPKPTPAGGSALPGGEPGQPAPVAVGEPLYKAAPLPPAPKAAAATDPVVIANASVHYNVKVQVAAETDGKVELIATPLPAGTPVDPKDPTVVFHPRDDRKQQPFRQIRDNDKVVDGQLLFTINDEKAVAQRDTAASMIEASDSVIKQSKETLGSYQAIEALFKKLSTGVAAKELLETASTVSSLQQRLMEAQMNRTKSEGDLMMAKTAFRQCFGRSPVNGRVTRPLKTAGEFAKAGEPILEIQSTDRVRVEGKLPSELASLVKVGVPAVVEPTIPVASAFGIAHWRPVAGLAVTPHAGRPLVVSAGLDGSALVWDATKTRQAHALRHPAGVGVTAVACSPVPVGTGPDATLWAATGASDGRVRLWNVTAPDALATQDEPAVVFDDSHAVALTCAAFSPDGKYLATAAGPEVFVWDVAAKKKMYALQGDYRADVTAVRFTPQATLVTVTKELIQVWQLGTTGAALSRAKGAGVSVLDHRAGGVDVLGVSADGGRVLFDKEPARLEVVSLADGRTVGSVVNPGPAASFSKLALFGPGDGLILTASGGTDAQGELQLWKAPAAGGRAAELRRLVTPNRVGVTAAAFSPDPAHPFVVVGTQNGGVHLWPLSGPTEQSQALVGRVEAVLPADSRSYQVRVVLENPDGADVLQERGTATIIIDPTAAPTPGPAPAAVPAVRPAGGPVPDGGVFQAGGAANSKPLPFTLPPEVKPAAGK